MFSPVKETTVCIIDDDPIFAFGFHKLSKNIGLFSQILHFTNGLEAVEYLTNPANAGYLPDVILLDINMPVMNGWEFSKKFEEIISHLGKNITLYIMSSSVDTKDITRAKNIPLVTDYLFKPISTTHLTNIYNNLQSDTKQFNYN